MYHTRKTTNPLDKVYALLGMSSDNPGINPDYKSSWKDLFRELINFTLSNPVSVSTWDAKEVPVMEANGYVLREVSSAGEDVTRSHSDAEGEQRSLTKGDVVEVAVIEANGYVLGEVFSAREDVEITWKTAPGHSDAKRKLSSRFTSQVSAKTIKQGDIVCLLEGASRPTTIIRPCDGFSTIIRIAGPPADRLPKWSHSITTFPTKLLLVWDWDESQRESQGGEGYEYFVSNRGGPKCPILECRCQDHLDKAARLWNLGMVLNGMERYEEAVKTFRKAMEVYGTEAALRSGDNKSHGTVRWGEVDKEALGIMDSPLFKDKGAAMEAKYTEHRQTPLRWAVEEGHEAVVKLLAGNGANVDAKDSSGRTPLLWAAERGHQAAVKLLLATGKADVDAKDTLYGQTPLSWAAGNGHQAIAKLLLATGKAEVDTKDMYGQTPLSLAAKKGHKATIRLLLAMGKANVNAKDNRGRTPLSWAAEKGHKAAIKLLLATGKADINAKDNSGRTPLSWASGNGHTAAIERLLAPGKADVDVKDSLYGQTPLSWAAGNGHKAAIELLLATGKADVEAKDRLYGQTPLSRAAKKGHMASVKLLLATGKSDVDAKDDVGQTPLSLAAENGHQAIVELLKPHSAQYS